MATVFAVLLKDRKPEVEIQLVTFGVFTNLSVRLSTCLYYLYIQMYPFHQSRCRPADLPADPSISLAVNPSIDRFSSLF